MVSIEYSPNGRASCQKCHGKIPKGNIRVCSKGAPVNRSSGYINKYHHAECYTNRKDLTQLYGFRTLSVEDQKRFMTEEQKRSNFPGDYIEEAIVAAASATSKGGLQKRSVNTDGESEQPMKKQKSKSTPKEEKKKTAPLSIVGLKYAEASAVVGEKVTLVREPENQYDSNAVKVLNKSNQIIGRIKKEHAAGLSKSLDKSNVQLVVEGTIMNAGNGWEQSVQIQIFKTADTGGGGSGVASARGAGKVV